MKTFKIYGEKYELEATAPDAPDAYGYKNELVDDPPTCKCVGYVYMGDGSCIECYKSFNPLVIILPIVGLLLIGAGIFLFLMFGTKKDVVVRSDGNGGGLFVKQGEDNNVVMYNGYMSCKNNAVNINFTNGSYPCTISITGEGLNSTPIVVQPEEFVASIPVTFDTELGLIQAVLTIKTDTSETTNNVVIEIPENTTASSPDMSLDGVWQGEQIYGIGNTETTE